jgi:S-adenosyl-L-methionine hydrolase (adenosine-forming)
MSAKKWITFLTDYGLENKFIGSCRGVIAKIAPDSQVLDITHLVPRGDIRHGALVLEQAVPYLPEGVHLAIVDPGVGTSRRALAVVVEGHVFVGPDNGLLPPAIDWLGTVTAVHELTEPSFMLRPLSNTFHGRDVFSPFAAHIAAGAEPADLGPAIDPATLVRLPVPVRRMDGDKAEGEVLIVDRFGNLQTSVNEEMLRAIGATPGSMLEISGNGSIYKVPYVKTFASVPEGELLAHVDSAGALAIAVNLGDATEVLGIGTADLFAVRLAG